MKTPQLNPYLNFNGTCREAMTFYQACLGGELMLQAVAESPAASHLPAADQNGIIHSVLTVSETLMLFASDVMGGPPAVADNSSVQLCLNCHSEEQIDAVFSKLGEGGTVTQPLEVMFWGGKYGALTDRFGKQWLFNFQAGEQQ
ncbi:VOC family protein [Hymenobacter sp. ASUV-10]|uniref:VOC family protein n=1 Tax=Hymenobacter aranciens TaxID=3063996 RepID=A0ABT9BG20_9BACT|nr:VOC family protein [Hymenobacter sp. ASUV-10]MDO7877192.1 VOC family protein [Hymenobacter sp. ASUV-10]